MPMEPATDTIAVRLRLDKRFLSDSENAIVNGMDASFFAPLLFAG